MKRFVVLGLSIVVFSAIGYAEGGNPEEAVLQAERNLAQAYQRSDAAAIERGVTEDYTLTNSRGKITTRADDLEEARKVDPKYEVFENEDMKVRVHGKAAVVLGITHAKGVSGGEPFDARFLFTDTFVEEGGQWRLCAGHVTKVSPESKQ
jgi:ketosteroid isomerase-like protein